MSKKRNSSKFELNKDQLVAIFFVFVLSTISLFLIVLNAFAQLSWQSILRTAFFWLGFLGYTFVVIMITLYYLKGIWNWLKKDNRRLVITIVSLLALSHAIFMGAGESSWLSFLGYLSGDGLVIIGLLSAEKIIGKIIWENKKPNSKKPK